MDLVFLDFLELIHSCFAQCFLKLHQVFSSNDLPQILQHQKTAHTQGYVLFCMFLYSVITVWTSFGASAFSAIWMLP